MFAIDLRSRVPIYEQVKQNIIKLVSAGVLLPDQQLPGVRSLARDLGINPNTVQKAYSELEAEGFIYQATGRGTFVSQSDQAASALKEKELLKFKEEVIKLKKLSITKNETLTIINNVYEEANK